MSLNDYILATHPNPSTLGKRRKTQLKNLSNNINNVVNNQVNKPNYPNIKPIDLNKNKSISINKLHPNLKTDKSLDHKGLNDAVYTLCGVKDNIKVIDDMEPSNDAINYYYNKDNKSLSPKVQKQKNVLLSFKKFRNKIQLI